MIVSTYHAATKKTDKKPISKGYPFKTKITKDYATVKSQSLTSALRKQSKEQFSNQNMSCVYVQVRGYDWKLITENQFRLLWYNMAHVLSVGNYFCIFINHSTQ